MTEETIVHRAMGTVMTHKAFGPGAKAALKAVGEEMSRLEGLFSRFLPDSDVGRINRAAGIKNETVSPETWALLSEVLRLTRECPDFFQVTLGPVISLWGKTGESGLPPEKESLRRTLPLVNDRDVVLHRRKRTVRLRVPGQGLDLGGVGKGYAGDRIRMLFMNFGVTSAYSNLGGHVVTRGAKADGSPWRVGIQHPRYTGRLLGTVAVTDRAVVTSGDYRRFVTDARGLKYHHILDPATGYPSESGLISVSIVTENSLAADVLSTLVFVAGKEKGLAFLRDFPETEAVLMDTNLRVFITEGLRYRFKADKDIHVTILN